MSDTEKVIKGLEWILEDDRFGFGQHWLENIEDDPPQCEEEFAGFYIERAIALLKEQQERLDSIVCFENGDQVRTWHCPFCKSEVRFVLRDWNVIEDNLLGIKKVVERPQDIRVVTDDERVIVLKKEIPTMVMNRRDWSDNDA